MCWWIYVNTYVLAQYSGENQRALNLKWDGLNKELYIIKGRLAKKVFKTGT